MSFKILKIMLLFGIFTVSCVYTVLTSRNHLFFLSLVCWSSGENFFCVWCFYWRTQMPKPHHGSSELEAWERVTRACEKGFRISQLTLNTIWLQATAQTGSSLKTPHPFLQGAHSEPSTWYTGGTRNTFIKKPWRRCAVPEQTCTSRGLDLHCF